MRKFLLFLIASVVLVACTPKNSQDISSSRGSSSSAGSSLADEQPATAHVSYEGIVEPLGASIYMQGTHRLLLPGDRFLLLESDIVDLNSVLGEEVRVFGAARPTVEGGNTLVRVERIERLVLPSSSSSFSLVVSSEKGPFISSVASSSFAQVSSADFAASSAVSVEPPSSVPNVSDVSDIEKKKIALMAKERTDDGQWTQQYCSNHVRFCIPVHRNWWYKSFGTTTSTLWHIEIGPEPLSQLGDGPLVLNLLPGDVPSEDRSVDDRGAYVVGYRAWSEGRHFEVSAPKELAGAVRFITEHLVSQ